jgi:hypothetical protein
LVSVIYFIINYIDQKIPHLILDKIMGKNSGDWSGLLIFILIALAVIGSIILFFQDSFSLPGQIAQEVGLKFSGFVIIVWLLSLAFNSIFTVLFTIAIPTSIFWYRPILNEKALQVIKTTGEIPFYGTNNGQMIIAFIVALASFGFWAFHKYK